MKTLMHSLVIALLILSHASAADSPDKLVSRMYYLRSGALRHVTALVRGEKAEAFGVPTVTRAEWKQFFTHWKVSWPEGSEISYHSEIQRLVVKNTADNLKTIESVMSLGPQPMGWSQLEIEARFIAFERSTIIPDIKAGPLTARTILELQDEKKATILAAPVVRTPSGQQATIKSVTEYIYPTDFEVTPITDGGTDTNEIARIVGAIVQPGGFQTREVGVLMEVLPEVSTGGQLVHLTLTPQLVFDPSWKDYGGKYSSAEGSAVLPMKQPFFPVVTVTSSLTVPNNTFVLLGGGTPSPDGQTIIYTLVRARIVDLEGNTLGGKNVSNKTLDDTGE